MGLAAGTRLGPYEIVSALGAGGMGEVYRAYDTRLRRHVALKVLPELFAEDPRRKARFEKEARIIGALNHPNILAVFDVGTDGGKFFLVSELLDGQTLRHRISQGPLQPRKAVDYALQIARGLASAHSQGIAHRDLKPENIFITKDDRVKILDFGLAKQVSVTRVSPEPTQELGGSTATTGLLMGTPGYMAPEQVRAQKVDHRADIFSFGAVLYEMVSGQRAFKGDTTAEALNAILNQEPPDFVGDPGSVTAALHHIVTHCMEKKPELRFQCASDLAFAIETIADDRSSTHPVGSTGPRFKARAIVVMVTALLVAAGLLRFGIGWARKPPPSFRQLIFGRGYISSARFTPDGQSVVFGAAFYGRPREIFSTRLDGRSWRSMDLPPADISGIAQNGTMAISLGRHNFLQWMAVGTLGEAPLAGGPPRAILDNVCDADISPDGKDFAIVRCGEGVQELEFPIGHVLFRTNGWIGQPRISPSGDAIAFLEHPLAGDDRGYVSLVDTSGKWKRLTGEWLSEFGVAWSPSSREIWFSSASEGRPQELRAVTRSGDQRTIVSTVNDIALHDVSKDGRVLLTAVRVGTEIHVGHKGGGPDRALEVPDEHATIAGFSHDGKTIALSASGTGSGQDYSTLVITQENAEAVRLGDGDPISVSPDGKWVVSLLPSQPSKLVLYPIGVGQAQQIDVSPAHLVNSIGSWTSDGSTILFTGAEQNGAPRAYLIDMKSRASRPITPLGTSDAIISPDGQYVIARDSSSEFQVIPVAGGKAQPVKGLNSDEVPVQWDLSNRRLYVWNRTLPAKIFLLDVKTGTRTLWLEITPAELSGLLYGEVLMTPDGRSYGYRYRRVLSDLFLAEGLR